MISLRNIFASSNFVYFSSAVQRIKNFATKVAQISSSQAEIDILNASSGYVTSSNITILTKDINNIIENFDIRQEDFEWIENLLPGKIIKVIKYPHFIPIEIEAKIKEDPDASEEDKEIVDALTKINKFGRPYISSSLGVVTAAFKLKDKGWHNALADVQMTIDMLFAVINFIKLKKEKYSIDFSTVKPFDATAGDPYSRKRS